MSSDPSRHKLAMPFLHDIKDEITKNGCNFVDCEYPSYSKPLIFIVHKFFFSLYTPLKLSSVQNQSNEGDNMAGIRKFMWSLFSQNSKFARAVSKANFKPKKIIIIAIFFLHGEKSEKNERKSYTFRLVI